MIDFRYHLVSLISVFLALALGIVVGTTKLNGKVLDDLRGQVQSLKDDKHTLQLTERTLERQLRTSDQFADQVGPHLVSGVLKGHSVVIISTSNADNAAKDGLQKMLESADATVTGRVQLTDDYSDPRRAADIQNFVTGTQPLGFERPSTDDAGELAGALLSYVLLDKSASSRTPSGASAVDVSQVLSGFSGLNMLRLETAQVRPAEYAVMVTGAPPTGDTAAERSQTLVELADALDNAGRGAVVVGTSASAEEPGVIGQIRKDDHMMSKVSTVDDVDAASGRIAVVFALDEQGHGGSGQYGLADNAQEPFPSMDR